MGYDFRETDKRKEIFEAAEDRILPLIPQTSFSQAIDQSVKLGTRYVDRMREKKKELEEIDEEIEQLQERKREIKERWETENVTFSDL